MPQALSRWQSSCDGPTDDDPESATTLMHGVCGATCSWTETDVLGGRPPMASPLIYDMPQRMGLDLDGNMSALTAGHA
jgi:hypothetical protein